MYSYKYMNMYTSYKYIHLSTKIFFQAIKNERYDRRYRGLIYQFINQIAAILPFYITKNNFCQTPSLSHSNSNI